MLKEATLNSNPFEVELDDSDVCCIRSLSTHVVEADAMVEVR